MTLPKGKYYVGDPCYLLESKDYDTLVEAICAEDTNKIQKVFKDFKMYVHSTRFGDGVYASNIKTAFFVDSGMLGCFKINIKSLTKEKFKNLERLGAFIEFEKDFTATYENGIFIFDNITIDTNYYAVVS